MTEKNFYIVPDMNAIKAHLMSETFPVLDHGFIRLIDVMGSDQAIEEAARVSYGEGTRKVNETRGLLRYLMRMRHTSPFEQAELKFMVKCPMDVWRQWIRHRMSSTNEYSTRYSEAIDDTMQTPPDMWRSQSNTNKQGSSGFVEEWPEGFEIDPKKTDGQELAGEYLSDREYEFHKDARALYEERLKFGVAREQARKDLPLSTYTIAYWKMDLHNLLHFLSLRMDSHAQWEIRQYADIIGNEIVKPLFPLVWEAFSDYRLNAMSLSALEIQIIQHMNTERHLPGMGSIEQFIENKREQQECLDKLIRLGFIQPEVKGETITAYTNAPK